MKKIKRNCIWLKKILKTKYTLLYLSSCVVIHESSLNCDLRELWLESSCMFMILPFALLALQHTKFAFRCNSTSKVIMMTTTCTVLMAVKVVAATIVGLIVRWWPTVMSAPQIVIIVSTLLHHSHIHRSSVLQVGGIIRLKHTIESLQPTKVVRIRCCESSIEVVIVALVRPLLVIVVERSISAHAHGLQSIRTHIIFIFFIISLLLIYHVVRVVIGCS